MKLISLTYSPNGNIAGYKAQIVIDPQPGVFKAAYLHIVQDMAGDISIASEPYGSSEAQCDRAIAFSRRVLAGVTRSWSHWTGLGKKGATSMRPPHDTLSRYPRYLYH